MNVFEKAKACFGGKQRQIASLEVENKRLDKVVFDVSQENERLKAERGKISTDNSNLIKERDGLKEELKTAHETIQNRDGEINNLSSQLNEIEKLVDEANTKPQAAPKPKSKNVDLTPPSRKKK